MSITALIAIGVVALFIIFGVVPGMKTERMKSKKMKEFLGEIGLKPGAEHQNDVEKAVRFLGQCKEERTFSVQNLKCSVYNGKELFFYTKYRHLAGRNFVWFDEFLFRFKRGSDKPVIVYLSVSGIPEVYKNRLVGPIVGMADAFRHDLLVKLETPRALEGGNVLAAFGPPGSSLFDLLDSTELSLIQSGADRDAFIFMANEDVASVCYMPKYTTTGIHDFWQYVRQLIDYGN